MDIRLFALCILHIMNCETHKEHTFLFQGVHYDPVIIVTCRRETLQDQKLLAFLLKSSIEELVSIIKTVSSIKSAWQEFSQKIKIKMLFDTRLVRAMSKKEKIKKLCLMWRILRDVPKYYADTYILELRYKFLRQLRVSRITPLIDR